MRAPRMNDSPAASIVPGWPGDHARVGQDRHVRQLVAVMKASMSRDPAGTGRRSGVCHFSVHEPQTSRSASRKRSGPANVSQVRYQRMAMAGLAWARASARQRAWALAGDAAPGAGGAW